MQNNEKIKIVLKIYEVLSPWFRGYHNCTAFFNSDLIKPEDRSCVSLSPPGGVSGICNCENLWQWSRLEIRLNPCCQSTIPQKRNHHYCKQWKVVWFILLFIVMYFRGDGRSLQLDYWANMLVFRSKRKGVLLVLIDFN